MRPLAYRCSGSIVATHSGKAVVKTLINVVLPLLPSPISCYPTPNMQETDAHSTGACDCTKHLVLGWEYLRIHTLRVMHRSAEI